MHSVEWFLTEEKVKTVYFSPKFRYKDETWCIPLISGSKFSPQRGVYRHFSLLKRSKSAYLTFFQRNSHYDIIDTSASLFICHILTKKTEIVSFHLKIPRCLNSIQCFTITDDLILTSQ